MSDLYLMPTHHVRRLRRGGYRSRALEYELAIRRVDLDRVAGREATLEDGHRQRVDQTLLDNSLQRPRTVGRVVAEVAEQRLRRVGQLDLDPALAHARDEPRHLEVDDLRDLLATQRVELDDVVQPVDELRLEVRLDAGPASRDIRGHDQHGVLERDRPALAVGQATVVHHLEQRVEHVRVRLLDLVEEHDAVRAPADRLGQLNGPG